MFKTALLALALALVPCFVTADVIDCFGTNEDSSVDSPVFRSVYNGKILGSPGMNTFTYISGSGVVASNYDLGNMWGGLAGVTADLTYETSTNGQAQYLGGGSFQASLPIGEWVEFKWAFSEPVSVRTSAFQGLHPGEYFAVAEADYLEYNSTVNFDSNTLGAGPGLQNTSTTAGSGAASADSSDTVSAYDTTTFTIRYGSEHTTTTLGGSGFAIGMRAAPVAVPEPSSLALIGLGCTVLIARRRRNC